MHTHRRARARTHTHTKRAHVRVNYIYTYIHFSGCALIKFLNIMYRNLMLPDNRNFHELLEIRMDRKNNIHTYIHVPAHTDKIFKLKSSARIISLAVCYITTQVRLNLLLPIISFVFLMSVIQNLIFNCNLHRRYHIDPFLFLFFFYFFVITEITFTYHKPSPHSPIY